MSLVPGRSAVAKKVLLIAFGAVLALVGAVLAVGGVVLFALTRGDGYFASATETLRTPTRALVSEPQALTPESDGFDATVRVRVTATGGGPVFVGVGPTAEVDRYLAGSSYDEVRDVEFSPFRYVTARQEGERELPAPADQPLWTARATGTGEQTLEVRVADGGHRLVIMNADAAAEVEVRASFGIRVPFLRRLGVGLLGGAVLGLLVGLLLVALGIRTKVPPRQPPWGPYGPAPAGAVPPGSYPGPGWYPSPAGPGAWPGQPDHPSGPASGDGPAPWPPAAGFPPADPVEPDRGGQAPPQPASASSATSAAAAASDAAALSASASDPASDAVPSDPTAPPRDFA